jgi:Ca2+-binding RTX toxin-like protein
MERIYRSLSAALVAAGLLAVAGSAHALVTITENADGDTYYIGVRNSTTYLCNHTDTTETTIVASATLTDDVRIVLAGGNDKLEILRANETRCGQNYTPVSADGYIITVEGGDGDDELHGGAFTTPLRGEAGADSLKMYDADGSAIGGAGNDLVCSDFTGGGEELFGNSEVDCLEQIQEGTAVEKFDCGTSTDSYDAPTGSATNCDSATGSCSCLATI